MRRACGQANMNDDKQIKKPLQLKEEYIILQRRDGMKRTFHRKYHNKSYMKGSSMKISFQTMTK